MVELIEYIKKPIKESDLIQKWRELNPELDQDTFYMQISNAKKAGIVVKREDGKLAIDTSIIQEQVEIVNGIKKNMKDLTYDFKLPYRVLEFIDNLIESISNLLIQNTFLSNISPKTLSKAIKITNKQKEVLFDNE